jgi:hypothetical protein
VGKGADLCGAVLSVLHVSFSHQCVSSLDRRLRGAVLNTTRRFFRQQSMRGSRGRAAACTQWNIAAGVA